MRTYSSTANNGSSRPKITLLMVLCGVVGAVAAGTAGAATADDSVPSITVKYDPLSLTTDAGAKAMYRRLVKAAETVCPDVSGGHLVSMAAQECRDHAIERAVQHIDNPRLAAADGVHVKKG